MQQLDEVSRHFAHIISGVKAAGKTIFDVKPEAEAKYIELMWKMSPPATGRPSGCTPGYCKLRCPRTSAQLSFLCSVVRIPCSCLDVLSSAGIRAEEGAMGAR